MPGIALKIRRKCKVCEKVFLAKTLESQFCSKRCGDVYRKRQRDAEKKEDRFSQIILQIPDAREYISVKEAVAIFGVERDTIYRLIKKGRIPAINLGTRLIRIKKAELEKLLPTRVKIKIRRQANLSQSSIVLNPKIAIRLARFARNTILMIVRYGRMYENTLSHQDR